MAQTYIRIFGPVAGDLSFHTIYTVPTGKKVREIYASFSSSDGSNAVIPYALGINGFGAGHVPARGNVNGGTTAVARIPHVLNVGDTIGYQCGSNTDCVISGILFDA